MALSSLATEKAQKLVPASVLKQLRAVIAVRCYNMVFSNVDMNTDDQKRSLFNMYHGCDEKNIISQTDLLINGKGVYKGIFDIHPRNITDKDGDGAVLSDVENPNEELVLKKIYYSSLIPYRFTSGLHFTRDVLGCPTKNVTDEKCSGRFLLDLAKSTVANLKKAVVIAEEWLDDGKLPSGKNWGDLYAHLLVRKDEINSKEEVFTGLMSFICHSKYNEGGKNMLDFLAINDDDGTEFGKGGRCKRRKMNKEQKDTERSLEAGNISPFADRGLTLDSRIQIVELAQFEDSKAREIRRDKLHQMTTRYRLLLDERKQEMDIAKVTCPQYDSDHPNWKSVYAISEEIKSLKHDIKEEEINQERLSVNDNCTDLWTGSYLHVTCRHDISAQ